MTLKYVTSEEYNALVARLERRREAVAAIAKIKASPKFRMMSLRDKLDALRPLETIARETVEEHGR